MNKRKTVNNKSNTVRNINSKKNNDKHKNDKYSTIPSSSSANTYENSSNKGSTETIEPGENDIIILREGKRHVPKSSVDVLTKVRIREGEEMADFHDEGLERRFYTRRTYKALKPKLNPHNRKPIKIVTYYTATFGPGNDFPGRGYNSTRTRGGGRRGRVSLRNRRTLRR